MGKHDLRKTLTKESSERPLLSDEKSVLMLPWRLQPLKSLEKTGFKQQPDDQKSLPSGTESRSEAKVDFGGTAGKRRMCMSHNKNLAPMSRT